MLPRPFWSLIGLLCLMVELLELGILDVDRGFLAHRPKHLVRGLRRGLATWGIPLLWKILEVCVGPLLDIVIGFFFISLHLAWLILM